MSTPIHESLALVREVATRLQDLNDSVVFVGGCATGLLISDPEIVSVRPTKDVDVIVEVFTRTEFHRLEKNLRKLGFENDQGGPICRWSVSGISVDFMPDDEAILGFSNKWYRMAIESSERRVIGDKEIRVLTPSLFLATKLEAFHGRGEADFLGSHDLEDIIAVIDGRGEIVEDCYDAPDAVKEYLREEFTKLLSNEDFIAALPGHVVSYGESPDRSSVVLDRLRDIVRTLARQAGAGR